MDTLISPREAYELGKEHGVQLGKVRTIELNYDAIDKIIIDELKDIYLFHLKDKDKRHIDDIRDRFSLLSALQILLDYYMSAEEKDEWSLKLQGAIVSD